jgi:glycosyltransferase involved in cell wall biosynthesis
MTDLVELNSQPEPLDAEYQRVVAVPGGIVRPLWSVMIPTFNCANYLREALESVLTQDLGPTNMQIEVVDDCSSRDDPEAIVDKVGRGRVQFYRSRRNQGAIPNFNRCVNRSTGRLVHILHGDDLVQSDYYTEISDMATRHPDLGLYATRSFFIDKDSVISGVTGRVMTLEEPGRSVEAFFYTTPIQFSGVTVRRSSYEKLGGFRRDLVHTADCEMWVRVVASDGGLVSNKVKSYYRIFPGNDSGLLAKTAENVRDLCRLNEIFATRNPGFSMTSGQKRASDLALYQLRKFESVGECEAANANRRLWVELTPFKRRLAHGLRERVMPYVRKILSADK